MAPKAAMVSCIDALRPGREAWKVIARVLRMWESCPIGDPANPYALQLLLIDVEVQCVFMYTIKFNFEIYKGSCNDS